MRSIRLIVFVAVLAGTANAAPPPPPPEWVGEAAKKLVPNQSAENFDAYSSAFANDLKVFVNEKEVAGDREAWLAQERTRMNKVVRRPLSFVMGWERDGRVSMLVIDQYDDYTGVPENVAADPRPIIRAGRYVFGDDKLVHELRFVQTPGPIWFPEDLEGALFHPPQ